MENTENEIFNNFENGTLPKSRSDHEETDSARKSSLDNPTPETVEQRTEQNGLKDEKNHEGVGLEQNDKEGKDYCKILQKLWLDISQQFQV